MTAKKDRIALLGSALTIGVLLGAAAGGSTTVLSTTAASTTCAPVYSGAWSGTWQSTLGSFSGTVSGTETANLDGTFSSTFTTTGGAGFTNASMTGTIQCGLISAVWTGSPGSGTEAVSINVTGVISADGLTWDLSYNWPGVDAGTAAISLTSTPQSLSAGSVSTFENSSTPAAAVATRQAGSTTSTGSRTVYVPVSLQVPAAKRVTFAYAFADGTAKAGVDYVATAGTATIARGQTGTNIPITILGATNHKSDVSFTVVVTPRTKGYSTFSSTGMVTIKADQ